MKLYRQLADDFAASIREGTLEAGARVPSVRQLSRERGLSPATVVHAYELLEAEGFIETRPRSGFYVSAEWRSIARSTRGAGAAANRDHVTTATNTRVPRTTRVDVSELVFQVLESVRNHDVVPLGSAFPSPTLFPLARLARCLSTAGRQMDPWNTVDALPPGNPELRAQLARRYLRAGARVATDEVVVTSGALEGLNLCLQILTRPGDIVAIESPAFYGCLQAIEALRLRAIEIPTHPRDGVDVGALSRILDKHPVRACWLMTNFQNPLGALVPEEAKKDLVRLLEKHEVPLIEDDVYMELYFGRRRPKPAKAFDRKGLVLHCSSMSKCLAPGYRIGWVAAGRFATALQRRKIMSSLSTTIPAQDAITLYLREGGYERHLAALRRELANQQAAAVESLARHLPPGYRLHRPEGGYFLWLELPAGTDAIEIHARALEQGFSVAPGPIFSAQRRFRNCLRINTGHPWTAAFDTAVHKLGNILRGQA